MSDTDAVLTAHLQPGEEALWSGAAAAKPVQNVLLVGSVLIAVGLLWIGWSDGSPIQRVAPTLAVILFSALALPFIGFALLALLDRTNSKETVLTNIRVLNINRVGGVSPETGLPYDQSRSCEIVVGGEKATLEIPVVTLEPGYPNTYPVARLNIEVAESLAEMIDGLGKGHLK